MGGVKLKDQGAELPAEMVKALTEAVDTVDLSKIYDNDTEEHDQLNVWIPVTCKEKYRRIQKDSRHKFGRALQQAVILLIEKADKLPVKAG